MELLGTDELSVLLRYLYTPELIVFSAVNKFMRKTVKKTIPQLCAEQKLPSTTSVRDYALFFGNNSAAFGEYFGNYSLDMFDITAEFNAADHYGKAEIFANALTNLRLAYTEEGAEGIQKRLAASPFFAGYEDFMQNGDALLMSIINNYKQVFSELLAELPCGRDAENWDLLVDLLIHFSKTPFVVWWEKMPPLLESFNIFRCHFLDTEESIREALSVTEECEQVQALLAASCRCSDISEELFAEVVELYKNLARELLASGSVCMAMHGLELVSKESFGWLMYYQRYDLLRHVARYIDQEPLTSAERYILTLCV